MLGRALLKYRQTFGKGVRVAWYRDVVRKRILQSSPIDAADTSCCEIHVLTSADDWLNLIWALKSFYHASGRSYGLCIHDDGSLNDQARSTIQKHFPRARLLERSVSEQAVLAGLDSHPQCHHFRVSNQLAPKVFDFRHFLDAERMLLLDSDVLFFSEPTELLHRIECTDYSLNSVNEDVASAYTVNPEDIKTRFGFELIPRFNSGLGLIHKASLNLDWIEEFLCVPNIIGHIWRIEQTLYALCSSRYGVELLPEPYRVSLTGQRTNEPSRHYVGTIRHLMYVEGIQQLSRVSQEW